MLPADYAQQYVELAYATTVHGAQGETVDHAHVLVGETTGAAAAYVAMTRGRESNVAHLVAEDVDQARAQWVEVFSRDRADLGPAHAATVAGDDIDRYGPQAPARDHHDWDVQEHGPDGRTSPATARGSAPIRRPQQVPQPWCRSVRSACRRLLTGDVRWRGDARIDRIRRFARICL